MCHRLPVGGRECSLARMSHASVAQLCLPAIGIAAALVFAGCGDGGKAEELKSDSPSAKLAEGGEILAGISDFDASAAKLDDPNSDGWDTEAFNDVAGSQLELLGKWLVSPTGAFPSVFADQVEFSAPATERRAVRDDRLFRIERRKSGDQKRLTIESLISELAREWGWLANAEEAQFKFKIHELTPITAGSPVTGSVLAAFSARVDGKRHEEHSTWHVRWTSQTPPRIEHLQITEWESSMAKGEDGTLFSDCTASALGSTECYEPQILRGLNHWLRRVPFRLPVTLFGTPGVALGDVNGDGFDDLYLCQEDGLPNRLFLQKPDGTLDEASAAWGVDWIEDSRSALLLDLDNDGDQDLVVACFANVVIACNEGARFEVRTVLPASETLMTLCAADYDKDGRLDLYVCGYDPNELFQAKEGQVAVNAGPFVYYDSNNGAPNSLFRNRIEGDIWKFEDATAAAGLDENNRRWSYAASWEDFDNDGDQDLYVANDFGRNNLYRNDGGPEPGRRVFVDIAAEANAEDSASGMSVSWGDYDRDGLMDLHVGNMWSSAGRRIVAQEKFKPEISGELRDTFKRFARGNTLMRNAGGKFDDVSESAGITMGRWAWSAPFVDIDNDGWEDLVVANGYITGGGSGDL